MEIRARDAGKGPLMFLASSEIRHSKYVYIYKHLAIMSGQLKTLVRSPTVALVVFPLAVIMTEAIRSFGQSVTNQPSFCTLPYAPLI